MRIAGSLLGVVGGLAAGLLGAKWLIDAGDIARDLDAIRALGISTAEVDRLVLGAYLLLLALGLGVAGAVLAMRGRERHAGGLMMLGGAAPAIVAPAALAFTWILLVGAVVSLVAPTRSKVQGPKSNVG
jgi:hypothetical protein